MRARAYAPVAAEHTPHSRKTNDTSSPGASIPFVSDQGQPRKAQLRASRSRWRPSSCLLSARAQTWPIQPAPFGGWAARRRVGPLQPGGADGGRPCHRHHKHVARAPATLSTPSEPARADPEPLPEVGVVGAQDGGETRSGSCRQRAARAETGRTQAQQALNARDPAGVGQRYGKSPSSESASRGETAGAARARARRSRRCGARARRRGGRATSMRRSEVGLDRIKAVLQQEESRNAALRAEDDALKNIEPRLLDMWERNARSALAAEVMRGGGRAARGGGGARGRVGRGAATTRAPWRGGSARSAEGELARARRRAAEEPAAAERATARARRRPQKAAAALARRRHRGRRRRAAPLRGEGEGGEGDGGGALAREGRGARARGAAELAATRPRRLRLRARARRGGGERGAPGPAPRCRGRRGGGAARRRGVREGGGGEGDARVGGEGAGDAEGGRGSLRAAALLASRERARASPSSAPASTARRAARAELEGEREGERAAPAKLQPKGLRAGEVRSHEARLRARARGFSIGTRRKARFQLPGCEADASTKAAVRRRRRRARTPSRASAAGTMRRARRRGRRHAAELASADGARRAPPRRRGGV